jgi:hypothetical protein
MPAHSYFAQAEPPAAGPPHFDIDLSGLSNGIWSALMAHMNELGTAAWTSLSQWLYSLLRGMFLGIWNATLLPIPHNVTDQFAPVQAIFNASGPIAAAGLVLAVVLLGVRTLVRGITGQGGVLDELMGRLMVYSCALSLLPWIIGHGIDLEQAIARSVAVDSLDAMLPQTTVANPIALVLLIIFGLRLWLKVAANVVHVAVAVAWSPVALACGLIPEGAWVASLWVREFVGRLAGAVLATVASGIGLALALGQGGDFAIFGVAGAFLAAADLVDWLARTPGSGMGGLLGLGMRAGVGLMGGGGGAAAAAAIPANQLTTAAEMYGYD